MLTLAPLPRKDEPLHALRLGPRLQTMVATPIYAGLPREEPVWLTRGRSTYAVGMGAMA